ncbi:hypothetical protein EAH89_26290 [Roseomonas nepalensis]|uniref:Uncharacterized protein n=1 Tax=Muricoccus nepalensis TaxID=1854500 RepID=A0A502F8J0_9PROT|nr:hypothetical protein [Roseomonas nepalensis]TPG45712.1 hypothetical protein EAH89_26290 [Roseomonas nepalensis]
MPHTLTLPAGTNTRLHILSEPQAQGRPFAVIVAPSAELATPDAFFSSLTKPGGVAAMLTHDPGVSRTDRTGEQLLAATLDVGGVVLMGFVRLADAMGAQAKLRKITSAGGAA